MHHRFSGSVVDDNGNPIYQAVSGTIVISQSGQLKSWAGVLEIESGEPPSLFNGKLVVNGKQGTAFGTSVNYGSTIVEFQGSGSCPL